MPLDDITQDSILNQVLLCTLSISVFSGERVDRKVSDEIAQQNNTDASDTGRFNKQIIGKHSLEGIKKVAAAARQAHYDMTLPYSDVGQRMLGAAGFLAYSAKMNALRDQFDAEVATFINTYPKLIEDAKTRLNGLFNETDYPSIPEMKRRFEFEFRFSPMPQAGNWFLEGLQDEMESLQGRVTEHVNKTIREGVRDVWQRVLTTAGHVHERLTNYDVDPATGKVIGSVFRDSLIENLKEMVDLLPALNITNDPELAEAAADLARVTRYSAKALRADSGFRKDAAAQAQKAMQRAAAILA